MDALWQSTALSQFAVIFFPKSPAKEVTPTKGNLKDIQCCVAQVNKSHLIQSNNESHFGNLKCDVLHFHLMTHKKLNTYDFTSDFRKLTAFSIFLLLREQLIPQRTRLVFVF